MQKIFEIVSVQDNEFYRVDPNRIQGTYFDPSGTTTVYLFDAHRALVQNYAMFSERLNYCLANDFSHDDPIANPVLALTLAKVNRRSDGLDCDQIREAMKGWFTLQEAALIEEKSHAMQSSFSTDARVIPNPSSHRDLVNQGRRPSAPRA